MPKIKKPPLPTPSVISNSTLRIPDTTEVKNDDRVSSKKSTKNHLKSASQVYFAQTSYLPSESLSSATSIKQSKMFLEIEALASDKIMSFAPNTP